MRVKICRPQGPQSHRAAKAGLSLTARWPMDLWTIIPCKNSAGNGSHSQHLYTRVALLFLPVRKGKLFPLTNRANDHPGSTENQHQKTEIQRQKSGPSDDEKQTTENMAPHASSRVPQKAKFFSNILKSNTKTCLTPIRFNVCHMSDPCL